MLPYLILIQLALSATPQKYDTDNLPYHSRWGSYTVVVDKVGKDQFAPERVRILDAKGRVVREIHDQMFDKVEFVELDGKAPAELYISASTGGAHCCETDYFFTQEGGVRNLLIFDAGNGSIIRIADLGKNGHPELIASSDVLAYFDGLAYAYSPGVTMVIGWDGQRYVDQTRLYPGAVQEAIRTYRNSFLSADKEQKEFREDVRRSGALGYYANMLAVGRGQEARAWLLKRMPRSTREWLLANEKTAQQMVASSSHKIRVSQEKLLAPKP